MKKFCKSEKGVAAIEMALLTPLLLVLTFGMVEFGVLLYDKAMITNASREAARAAIVWNGTDEADFCGDGITAQDAVDRYLGNHLVSLGGSQTATVTDVLTEASGTIPRTCTVTVNYNYDFLILPDLLARFFKGGLDGRLPIQAVTEMRMEQEDPDA